MFPVYDQTFSKSAGIGFSGFLSGGPLEIFLFLEGGVLPGLPVRGVEEQNVGVANGEANGECWIEKGLGDIRFWIGRPPKPPLPKRAIDSAAAHRFTASST